MNPSEQASKSAWDSPGKRFVTGGRSGEKNAIAYSTSFSGCEQAELQSPYPHNRAPNIPAVAEGALADDLGADVVSEQLHRGQGFLHGPSGGRAVVGFWLTGLAPLLPPSRLPGAGVPFTSRKALTGRPAAEWISEAVGRAQPAGGTGRSGPSGCGRAGSEVTTGECYGMGLCGGILGLWFQNSDQKILVSKKNWTSFLEPKYQSPKLWPIESHLVLVEASDSNNWSEMLCVEKKVTLHYSNEYDPVMVKLRYSNEYDHHGD